MLNISFYKVHVCACVLSRVQLFVIPWTEAHQASLSMEFPRQESWSRLPFPPPGNLPTPRHFLLQEVFPTQGSNLCLLHLLHWQADSFPLRHLGSPSKSILYEYLQEVPLEPRPK